MLNSAITLSLEVPKIFAEVGMLSNKYGEKYHFISGIAYLIFIIDIIPIILTRKKRAFHDVFVNTYVVTKDSIEKPNKVETIDFA